MTYHVKEIFYTLQGEGANSGRPAVFCRFSGCNLWSGLERDRSEATCWFCDTDFVGTDGPGGGAFQDAQSLATAVEATWPHEGSQQRFVVCTGGEPLLQLDVPLVRAFHERGFEIAIETNGTQPVTPGVDWVCVSPKGKADVVVREGDELKLVFPQTDIDPATFETQTFDHFFLVPMDGASLETNTKAAIQYCLEHPRWRLGVQMHKVVGVP